MSQIFTVLTLAVFHSRVFLPLATATITTSFLTRTCNYEFLLYLTKELVRNKHAVEELLAKVNWLQFWFVGIKSIEANIYEVVSSQKCPLIAEDVRADLVKVVFWLHKSRISNHQKILQQY